MLEDTNIWLGINTIIMIFEVFIVRKVIFSMSSSRASKVNSNIMFLGISILCIFMILFDVLPNERIIIIITLTMIFYKYSCNVKFFKVVVVSLVYWMLILGIDAISMSGVLIINSLSSFNVLLEGNIFRVQAIVLSKLILIVTSVIYCKKSKEYDIIKKEMLYMLIPIVGNIVSYLVIYKFIFLDKDINLLNNRDNREIIFLSILLISSNVSLIFSIKKIIDNNKVIIKTKILEEKIKIQYNHYINMEKNNIKVRKLHHDIKNHIACIKGIGLNNSVATEYIDEIVNEISRYDTSFNTGNMILDVVLNEKNKICIENQINLVVAISNFDICCFIESMDICSIFANVLDNAIEACKKIQEGKKEIILRGTIINDFFVIRAENTKVNMINLNGNVIKTDKKNSHLHGLGIKSIQESIDKYYGQVVVDYTDYRFIMKILIPVVPK